MKLIKIINGSIYLEHYIHNENQNISIGLDAFSFASSNNLIAIEKDCQITINNNIININNGQYTKEQLNKLINPLVISFVDKKIKIESPCYYNLDDNLKKYLGFQDIEFNRTSEKKIIYYPRNDEYYINIEQECKFSFGRQGEIPTSTIPIEIYTINEIENLINCYDFPKISFELVEGILNITASIGLFFDEYLSKCLGIKYIGYFIPINKVWPESFEVAPDINYKIIASNKPKSYTHSFLNDINGIIETKSSKTVITKQNYTIDQLNKLLPLNIKIQQTDNNITITAKDYYLLDENLSLSLGGLDGKYSYKHIGSDIILGLNSVNKILEVHCDIIEKSISNHNIEKYLHKDDDILCAIKCDVEGQ